MWYEFNSLEEFNVWHDALCMSLGYPIYGVNQLTGLVDLRATPITAYTEAHLVESKWICWVDEEHSSGLTETLLRLPEKMLD
jgi:hypothetical protein